jgi:regulator of protease activity HflC (stomatin/prohibitin superfamily)
MGKRISLILGWIIALITFLTWNNYYAGQKQYFDNYDRLVKETNHPTLSIGLLLIVMGIWYLVHWVNMINEWDRRPFLRFGSYIGTRGPGLCLMEPLFNTALEDIPVQDVVEELEEVRIQTKDNVGIIVDGLLTYCVDKNNVEKAVVNVEDVMESVISRACSTLTDQGGKEDLDHILSQRTVFCQAIVTELKNRVQDWGVIIKAFEIRGFKIADPAIENAIAMKAKAQKEGEAEIVRANMQLQVAEALNKAGKTYDADGRWLKGIEAMIELCRSANNNTVLIPTNLTDIISKVIPSSKV